jgi:hypothetical protein
MAILLVVNLVYSGVRRGLSQCAGQALSRAIAEPISASIDEEFARLAE